MARGREYEEWGKEGRREKGGRGRKKEISSERDAPSSQRSESASSTHRPYTIVFTRLRPFHPSSFRFTREDQQDSFAHTWLLRPRTSSSSPPRARKRITTPFGKKKEKKHTVSWSANVQYGNNRTPPAATVISFPPCLTLVAKSGRGISRPSARHAATFSIRPGVRRSFPFESSPMGGSRSLHRWSSTVNNSPQPFPFHHGELARALAPCVHDFPSRGPSPSHARSSRNESPRNGAQAQAVTAVTRAGNSRLLVPLLLSTSEVGCTDARNTRSERCIPYNVLLAVAKKGGRAGRERRTKWTAPKIRRRVSLERIERAVGREKRRKDPRGPWTWSVVLRACVRAYVRTPRACLVDVWERTAAARDGQELGLPLASCAGWRPLLAGSPRDEEGRSAGWDGARGKAVCMCALSGGHACALHVFLCVLVRVCREDAAARARAPLRARERASERERERLAGSLEADWWPDRALRPTVAASGRRLTESGNARRRRRGAASTRPPWPDSRLWTIDRSVHPPRRRKIYRKWGLDINLARRCFPLRTNL